MYLIHMPFAFALDKNAYVPAALDDGSYILDLDTDPVSVWKVLHAIYSVNTSASLFTYL